MKNAPIACSLLLVCILFNAACSPVVPAEKTTPGKPAVILPIKNGSTYENWVPTPMMAEGNSLWSVTWKWIQGGEREKPSGEIPIVPLSKDAFTEVPAGRFKVRWLGHSSALIEMKGKRILVDPVFNNHASPVPGFTRRFSRAPVRVEDLPRIDAVVISHDHYDHLEKDTIAFLSAKETVFFVPSGVSRYLKKWGVPSGRIRELSWWEESAFGNLTFICVPARHFSGRGLFDRDETLWAGWAVRDDDHSFYYSGDTGYGDHFTAIGERYGPFDLTMIKIGAYNEAWPYIHLNPEQAVKAQGEVKGKVLLPVHWATFPLALHPWDEPVIRVAKAAKLNKMSIITPMIGELVDMDVPGADRAWWENVDKEKQGSKIANQE